SSTTDSATLTFPNLLAPVFCPPCARQFTPVESPFCTICGLMFKSRGGEDHRCEVCLRGPKHFHKVRAFGVYDQSLREAIHLLKYSGKLQLARPLEILLWHTLLRYWSPEEIDLIIPAPLHMRRFRKRGFNQAYLLMRHWPRMAAAENLSLPSEKIARTALIRHRRTPHQVKMDREERRANIRNAFTVPDPEKIQDKTILLVDDVYTTGATADECARTLLKSGATRVDVLTLAQTTRRL
ncbi:MAG: ComF family protein, partial [Thermodesulfobacteriota bacterium]